MLKLYDYHTRRHIATIEAGTLSAWCEANRYLPHHQQTTAAGTTYIVIRK